VSQGSIFGPLLFLIYVNDLYSSINSSNAVSFADDSKCYKLILELADSAKLQHDLNSMANWSSDWNISFNTSKFIHLSFNATSYLIDNSITKTSNALRTLMQALTALKSRQIDKKLHG